MCYMNRSRPCCFSVQAIEDEKAQLLVQQEADLINRREVLVEGYREAQKMLEMPDKYEFIAGAADFEARMDAFVDMDLSVQDLDLTDNRTASFVPAEEAIRSISFDANAAVTELPPLPAARPPVQVQPVPLPPPPLPPPPAPVIEEAIVAEEVIEETVEEMGKEAEAEANEPVPKLAAPRNNPGSNAIYINGLQPDTTEADIRAAFEVFGAIKMVNAKHVSSGGFAFVFFVMAEGAAAALVDPRVDVKDCTVNVLAKEQILSGGGRWL